MSTTTNPEVIQAINSTPYLKTSDDCKDYDLFAASFPDLELDGVEIPSFEEWTRDIQKSMLLIMLPGVRDAVGYIRVRRNEDIVYLLNIVVTRNWRRYGIATKAMKSLLKMALNEGFFKISLHCDVKHVDVLKFYKKIGFVPSAKQMYYTLPFEEFVKKSFGAPESDPIIVASRDLSADDLKDEDFPRRLDRMFDCFLGYHARRFPQNDVFLIYEPLGKTAIGSLGIVSETGVSLHPMVDPRATGLEVDAVNAMLLRAAQMVSVERRKGKADYDKDIYFWLRNLAQIAYFSTTYKDVIAQSTEFDYMERSLESDDDCS